MGYIFDAINKKNGDAPKDQAPQDEVFEEALSLDDQTDNQASDPADFSTPQAEEDAAPLRLTDVQLSIDTNDQGEVFVDADENEPFDDHPAGDDDEDTADLDVGEPLQLISTTRQASWWSRLMGRHLRGKIDDRLVAMTSPASAGSKITLPVAGS